MSKSATIEMPLNVKLKLAKNDSIGDSATPSSNELLITYIDYSDLFNQIQAFINDNEADIRRDYL